MGFVMNYSFEMFFGNQFSENDCLSVSSEKVISEKVISEKVISEINLREIILVRQFF